MTNKQEIYEFYSWFMSEFKSSIIEKIIFEDSCKKYIRKYKKGILRSEKKFYMNGYKLKKWSVVSYNKKGNIVFYENEDKIIYRKNNKT